MALCWSEETVDILRRHHWFPGIMTSEKQTITWNYPDQDGGFDWLQQVALTAQPIRSNNKIREVTRHQWGIFPLDRQIPLRRETSGGAAMYGLCCWAIYLRVSWIHRGWHHSSNTFWRLQKEKKIGIPKIIEKINRLANFEDTLCNWNIWVWWQNPLVLPPYFSHCQALRWVPSKLAIYYRH